MMSTDHKFLRLAAAAACFVACCWAAWFSVRAGLSRLFSESAPGLLRAGRGDEAARLADAALRLNASDPEARGARACVLAERGDAAGAVDESARAAGLRPRYYLSWLRLGRARAQAGDAEGAAAAYRESVRLAPFYAEPRWQLGNLLLRAGRADEAFGELRQAAASRPALFGYTAELAWSVYGGDVRAVSAAVAPQTPGARTTLALFYAKRGRGVEAVELFRAGGREVSEESRRALVAGLLAAREFHAAREVWADGVGETGDPGGVGVLVDGGFEGRAAGPGFGWQFARDLQGVRASLDVSNPRAGAHSLMLEFAGAPDANARLAAQLALVEPGARYRLTFAARAEALASGGPPVAAVLGAGAEGRVLALSEALPRDGGWEAYELEFDAPAGEGAVFVSIRRQPCAAAPCPVFGRAWFDEFALRKVK